MTNLYSVSYNLNNATGGNTPPTQTAKSTSDTYTFVAPTAEQYSLLKTGYTFMGWAESPNAVFKEYEGGATVSLSNTNPTKTLYAVWAKPYTLKYSTGEGKGSVPAQETLMLGYLPYEYTPTGSQDDIYRKGYVASGWNKVTFTATTPSPTTTPTWAIATADTFNTMQDIATSGFCNGLDESGRQLFDIRDGKKYWVARLKDGNCWMTQNLDYDDPGGKRRTGDTKPDTWPNEDNTRQYWDPGEKIISGSTLANAASSTDRHLLVGNYYSWLSATSGTGASITTQNDNASDSICPEGWSLPLSGSNNGLSANSASGSFGKLLNLHGIANNAAGSTVLRTSPLYFLYGGYVDNSNLYNASNAGFYWSSTAYSSTLTYSLHFNSSNVAPSNYYTSRYRGMPIRCVAE